MHRWITSLLVRLWYDLHPTSDRLHDVLTTKRVRQVERCRELLAGMSTMELADTDRQAREGIRAALSKASGIHKNDIVVLDLAALSERSRRRLALFVNPPPGLEKHCDRVMLAGDGTVEVSFWAE